MDRLRRNEMETQGEQRRILSEQCADVENSPARLPQLDVQRKFYAPVKRSVRSWQIEMNDPNIFKSCENIQKIFFC